MMLHSFGGASYRTECVKLLAQDNLLLTEAVAVLLTDLCQLLDPFVKPTDKLPHSPARLLPPFAQQINVGGGAVA